jgi:hypothetical protein
MSEFADSSIITENDINSNEKSTIFKKNYYIVNDVSFFIVIPAHLWFKINS